MEDEEQLKPMALTNVLDNEGQSEPMASTNVAAESISTGALGSSGATADKNRSEVTGKSNLTAVSVPEANPVSFGGDAGGSFDPLSPAINDQEEAHAAHVSSPPSDDDPVVDTVPLPMDYAAMPRDIRVMRLSKRELSIRSTVGVAL